MLTGKVRLLAENVLQRQRGEKPQRVANEPRGR